MNTGNIQTKKSFTDYQLHIKWRIPANITGEIGPRKQRCFFSQYRLGDEGYEMQNNYELKGETAYIGASKYKKHAAAPIKSNAHGDLSEPISFRNIFIREL